MTPLLRDRSASAVWSAPKCPDCRWMLNFTPQNHGWVATCRNRDCRVTTVAAGQGLLHPLRLPED